HAPAGAASCSDPGAVGGGVVTMSVRVSCCGTRTGSRPQGLRGKAADCRSAYPGSTPGGASRAVHCGDLEAWVDGLRLQRKHRENRLVHLPERLVRDESGQRLQPQAVLTLGELPLLSQVTVTQNLEGGCVVGSV